MTKYLLLSALLIFQCSIIKAGIVIQNGLTHIFKVENGKVYKGKITLENNGRESQSVKIYLQDLSYQANGIIQYLEPGTNKDRSNAGWIKLSSNQITLKAGEKTNFLYELQVPADVALPGSHWSVIIVEPLKTINPAEKGISINSVVRYAIQIIADLRSENAGTDLKFENAKVSKEGNTKILKVAIKNTGELFCKPITNIDIFDRKTGEKIGRFSSSPMGLLPNNSKTFTIDISKVAAGSYNSIIMAIDENENTFALKLDLDIRND